MNEEQMPAQVPSQPARKSLEELMREAEQQAQQLEGGVPSDTAPVGGGFSFASLDAGGPVEEPPMESLPVQEEVAVAAAVSEKEVVQEEKAHEEPSEATAEAQTEAPKEVEPDVPMEPLKVVGADSKVSSEETEAMGPSLEEIEKELKRSQEWEKELKRKEQQERMRKVPVLPIFLSVLFVLFTSLFFSNPGGGAVQPLEADFLASIQEGDGRIFGQSGEDIVARTHLEVGDVIQTYEEETTLEFFDRSRVVLMGGTQIEIRGLSRSEGVIQLALKEGSVWVDDRNIHTQLEVFAHTQVGVKDIKGFYRSYLGTYLLTRSDARVDSYAATSPLYLVLEKENRETTTLIPPYSAATVVDSQLKQNVYDLAYSKAKTEFKIRSYLKDVQECVTAENCDPGSALEKIAQYQSYSLGYTLQLRTEGEFLVRGLALGEGSLKVTLQEQFPFLVFSEKKQEREASLATLYTLAAALERVLDGPTQASVLKEFQEVLDSEVRTLAQMESVRPLFLAVDIALPTDPLYEAKLLVNDHAAGLMTSAQRETWERERFIERNNEFYRLLMRNQTDFILQNLSGYLQEVQQFVEDRPEYIGLIEEARVLSENMLVAVPKLYETDIFTARYGLESLELSLVAENLRDPLRLEFARIKIDVMQQLYQELSTTSNAYLQKLYVERMNQLMVQFEDLHIERITFAVGPVRVLQSEYLALRRDYQALRGVAPTEEIEGLRELTEEELRDINNPGVGRVVPEEELSPEAQRALYRQNALLAFREIDLSMRIVSQNEELPRIFSVAGTVLGEEFTANFNVVTGAFSQISVRDQSYGSVVDKKYIALFLENVVAPAPNETTIDTGEQRNYYREQLQVARRKRVYEALIRHGVTVARVSDVRPYTTESTELYAISKATIPLTLEVAEGKEGLTQEEEFILEFSGMYNVSNDVVSQVRILLPDGQTMTLGQGLEVQNLATTMRAQFSTRYYQETYAALMMSLFDDEGIVVPSNGFEVSGEKYTLYKIAPVTVSVASNEQPVLFEGNLDVVSGNIYDARWSYQGKTYTILTLPVQELKEHIQNAIRAVKAEEDRQRRLEEERKRAEEEARQQRLREEQQRQYEQEAIQFVDDMTSRSQ